MNRQSTLCYIEKDGKYLMLHRVVKKNDVNKDKWIGVGGHFEAEESPEECLLREVYEETGYHLFFFMRLCTSVLIVGSEKSVPLKRAERPFQEDPSIKPRISGRPGDGFRRSARPVYCRRNGSLKPSGRGAVRS